MRPGGDGGRRWSLRLRPRRTGRSASLFGEALDGEILARSDSAGASVTSPMHAARRTGFSLGFANELCHREHTQVEDAVKTLKAAGASHLPFHCFAANGAWFELALLAHDIITWTQAPTLDGEHRICEPKRLRYRIPACRRQAHPPLPARNAAPACRLALGGRGHARLRPSAGVVRLRLSAEQALIPTSKRHRPTTDSTLPANPRRAPQSGRWRSLPSDTGIRRPALTGNHTPSGATGAW